MVESLAKTDRRGLAALAVVVLLYLTFVWLRSPADRFGSLHDDTLYAAAARAIADGQGYIQPNLPGSPPGTKYPPAHPYLLAFAMRLFPAAYADPGKLWVLSAAAGAWALIVAFLYLRRWKSVPWTLAAASIALCSLHEMFLLTSASLLSDVLFMALALTAYSLADRDRPATGALLGAAAFAGFAVMTRTVGVAVVAGIAVAYLVRREYRSAAVFSLAAAPFCLLALAPKLFGSAQLVAGSEGLRQTLLYYSDYAGFWRLSVPDGETLTAMLYSNLGNALRAPAELCLGGAPPVQIGKIGWVTLSAAIFSGLIRQARQDCWRPIHFGFAFTVPAILLWNFEIGDRLMLAYAPMFACGLWIEARHATLNFFRTTKAGNPVADRVFAVAFLVLMGCFGLFAAHRTARMHVAMASQPVVSYDEKYAALFAWMRDNTRPEDRFVATDDGLFYLRTGRQGMWPLALTTEPRFRPDKARFERQLELIPDVVEEIGARYIVQADHDFAYSPLARERWLEWTAGLPVLAQSADGSARILAVEPVPGGNEPLTELSPR